MMGGGSPEQTHSHSRSSLNSSNGVQNIALDLAADGPNPFFATTIIFLPAEHFTCGGNGDQLLGLFAKCIRGVVVVVLM